MEERGFPASLVFAVVFERRVLLVVGNGLSAALEVVLAAVTPRMLSEVATLAPLFPLELGSALAFPAMPTALALPALSAGRASFLLVSEAAESRAGVAFAAALPARMVSGLYALGSCC